MSISVFIVSLLLLQLICLIIGNQAAQKLNSQEDYFLAGRGIKFFPLMMTLIASQVGGGLVLGAAEEAYRFGWIVLLYPLGTCLGLIALAAGVGSRLSQFKVSTVAQLFETVYRSVKLKRIASSLSIVSLFMILIAQVMASKKFLASVGVDKEWLFLGFWAIVIFYTVMGGLRGVVASDIVQASFFIAIFFICFFYSILMTPDIRNIFKAQDLTFQLSQSKWSGWLLMPLCFMVIEQDMAQRCFAAKSGRTVSWASGFAALSILLICLIPIFYGVLGNVFQIEVLENSSILMSVLQHTTNPTLSALFACAVTTAIISTSISLINAISSNVAQDFEFSAFNHITSQLRMSQWITATIGCLAVFCSNYFDNVVDILIQSYELSVSCLLVPVVAILIKKEGHINAAIFAMIGGLIGFIVCRILPEFWLPKESISLLLSLIGFLIGDLSLLPVWKRLYNE